MPYVIVERESDESEKYCVYKESPDGGPVGEALGCHASREDAEAQQAALYAAEPEAKAAQMRFATADTVIYYGGAVKADGGLIPGQTRIYGAKVTENAVQALARIVVAEQMLKIRDAGYHVAFQVHDENVCVVPDAQAAQAEKDIVAIMSTAPDWAPDLPVACEAGVADCYGDA